jgi:hypothetical protein
LEDGYRLAAGKLQSGRKLSRTVPHPGRMVRA